MFDKAVRLVYQEEKKVKEVVHVTIFTFSSLMNNVSRGLCKDCTVWAGGGGSEFDINCTYSMSI